MTADHNKQKMLEISERIRDILTDDPNISEKKMFGGVCFLLNGNMLCGATHKGQLMLRIGKERWHEALQKPYTREMDFTGKSMKGMIYIEEAGFPDQHSLKGWLAQATDFVATLPVK